jgi:diguanylate cyclase (GGDEF)-like protein/PAS domain S-box-containing protein
MSENFLDIIKESEIFGVFVFQENGQIVYANERFLELMEFSKTYDCIGKSFFEYIINQKEEIIDSALQRAQGKQLKKEYREVWVKTHQGKTIILNAFVYTINYYGKPSGLVLLMDKTKEKSYEKLFFSLSHINQLIVRESNEKILIKGICDLLIDEAGYAGVGIGKIDSKTQEFDLIYANAKTHIDESEIKQLKASINQNLDYGKGTIAKAYKTAKPIIINDITNNSDLSFWKYFYKKYNFHSICTIPIFKNNAIEYILIIYDFFKDSFAGEAEIHLINEIQLDISFALNKIESQKNAFLLTEAIEKSHEWALITDKNGNILYVNQAVCEISYYSREELIGQNPRIFKSGFQDNAFYKKLWETIINGRPFLSRFVNKKKDGSLFYLDFIIIPIIQEREIYRFVSLGQDVSKVINLQSQIEFQSKLYKTLYKITNFSIESKSTDDFLQKLNYIFVDDGGFDLAYLAEITPKKSLNIVYSYAKNETDKRFLNLVQNYFESEKNHSKNDVFALQKTLKNKRIYIESNFSKKNLKPFNEYAMRYGFNSCCSIPILQQNKLIGALVLISRQSNIFNKDSYNLLKTAARQINFILTKLENDKFTQMALTAMNSGFEFVIITNDKFNIVYANDKAQEVSLYSRKELIGKHHSIFSSKTHTKEFAKNFYDTLKNNNSYTGIMQYKRKDGKILDFYVNIVPFIKDAKITNYIAVGKNIEYTDALLTQLETLLNYDSNTGLINLHAFEKAINRFLERAKYENQIGAVGIINPIQFKNINQAFGYNIGSELLKQIADRLKSNLRGYDVVAKLESDRFGLLLKDLKREEDIVIIAAKILNELTKPYNIENKSISLSFNIGLSFYTRDGLTYEQLINKAQVALIDARQKGDNQIGFFRRDLKEEVFSSLKLKSDLEQAIANKEFFPYFQPYVDSKAQIVGAEALMRWQKNEIIIPPTQFIEQLEQSNLIIDAENLIIDKVLDVIEKTSKNKIHIPISINLSSRSLFANHFLQTLTSKLNYYNIKDSLLNIEIVERIFMHDFLYIQNLIKQLKDQKILFSVDDFGTGYSSLSYLSELDIEYLKIDISFVRRLESSKKIQSTIKSIIFLAKELGIKTIAEGVETHAQFESLKAMGCDYFQGFLFYRPLTCKDFTMLIG